MNIQAARVGLVTARTVNLTDLLQMLLQGADRQMAMPTMYAFIAHTSLGPSWAVLGPSWGRPGAILGHLEAILGRLGAILGPSWAVLRPSGAILSRLGAILGPSWAVLRDKTASRGSHVAKTLFLQ
jgi:hypothetical protein